MNGDEILLTLDVSSLYTNIPNSEGCEAAYRALSKERGLESKPSNLSLIELLAQVLTYNNFRFNEDNYFRAQRCFPYDITSIGSYV